MTDFMPTAKVILDSISPDGNRLTDDIYIHKAAQGLALLAEFLIYAGHKPSEARFGVYNNQPGILILCEPQEAPEDAEI